MKKNCETIWNRIFDTKYFISSNGIVKSVSTFSGKETFLSTGYSKDGYVTIGLQINKKKKMFLVHRLIAIIFISNPENKLEVNHINGIKSDNRIENLEPIQPFTQLKIKNHGRTFKKRCRINM